MTEVEELCLMISVATILFNSIVPLDNTFEVWLQQILSLEQIDLEFNCTKKALVYIH